MFDDRNPVERPRTEPEIIPTDHSGRQSDWRNPPWRNGQFARKRGGQRIFVTRLGPIGVALLMLAILAIAVLIMIVVLGAVLIWLPVVAMLVVAAGLARLLRR
jgi:hypothetical protein